MPSSAASTPPPETIPGDRFILLEKIGEGGNAVVWRAQDREMRAKVAIKILRSTDPDLQARFAQEVLVLANLHHANVVRALARGVTSRGAPYVVLELVPGQSLRARLEAGGLLPWREVMAIGVQLAGALSALNAGGVVHRDVKPDNIMLMPDGNGGQVVKLIDFGVARLADGWDAGANVTPTPRRRTNLGVVVGTPGYTPPEAGYEPPSERFDVYGLAATLWEVGTGERPGGSPPATAMLPEDLRAVLVAALLTDPDDRTQTTAELGRGLAAVQVAHPEREPSALFDGRYERIAVIGTGACGEVYHACHRGSGHEVALKLLCEREPDDVRRFVREARLLAQLDHPCIPRFYDHAPDASPPYIAMARARGVPAVRLCPTEAERCMSAVEVSQVGLQLAKTLEYLHARGILHRDINANNVLIELHRSPRVTLIDFGSAALTEKFYSQASPRYLTPPEARVEVPDGGIERLPWAAPEAREGQGFSEKSDIYSLGFLLYRLLTGKRPATGDNGELVSPRRYNARCPQDVAQAILAALHPDPRARLDAAQLAERLRDTLEEDHAPADAAAVPSVSERVPAEASPLAKPDPWDRSTRGWTRFMAATAEPGTPTVHQEPPGPPAANQEPALLAKVLPLHPRDILDRATSLEPDFLPPPPRPSRRRWTLVVLGTLLMLGAAFVGAFVWSVRDHSTRDDRPDEVVSPPDPAPVPEPAAVAADAPDGGAGPTPSTPVETLARARAELTACAKRCGGSLWVELATTAGEPRFTSISAVCEGVGESGCARDVLDAIRFTPPDVAQPLFEEIRP